MRKYGAVADNGRDFIDFEFYSDHRANSKINKQDAQKEYKLKHGYAPKIISTFLIK